MSLAWSWQCVPYLACVVALTALGLVTVTTRGDRVLRLGMLGAVATTMPWAITGTLSACTHDADLATRLLRLGAGPVALIGPNLLLVLLGVTGQLERHRWLARRSRGATPSSWSMTTALPPRGVMRSLRCALQDLGSFVQAFVGRAWTWMLLVDVGESPRTAAMTR